LWAILDFEHKGVISKGGFGKSRSLNKNRSGEPHGEPGQLRGIGVRERGTTMETTIRKVSLKSRIIAVLLAALMIVGMSFYGFSATTADAAGAGVTPTGNEWILNPEVPENFTVPVGGLYRFEGGDFVPNTTVAFFANDSSGALLGTFSVDGNGDLVPAIADEPYVAIIIPEATSIGGIYLQPYYVTGTQLDEIDSPDAVRKLNILSNPYSADFSILFNPLTGDRVLHVENLIPGSFPSGWNIYMKIDYLESPYYGPIPTSGTGTLNADYTLPASLTNTGVHTFTILASETGGFPRLSLSKNLTV
jgi:hypothetical protein